MPARPMTTAPLVLERQYAAQGFARIAGVDEAGRGAWAGPVSAAAVVLPVTDPALTDHLEGVTDSKIMSVRLREEAATRIREVALGYGIGSASVEEISELNILNATKLAMRRALLALMESFPDSVPDLLFIDYLALDSAPVNCPQVRQPRFDSLSLTVAAASVLAKTWRDAVMVRFDEEYPGYGFARNKGYGGGTAHLQAIETLGACPQHRMTFKPLAQRRLL